MERDLTMLTSADTDVHVVEGHVDLVRMKVARNDWIMTTDGRYLRCDKVVMAWEPSEEELEGYLSSME